MRGVVVLVDDEHRDRVQKMAESLAAFGGTPSTIGLPHVTLHAAEDYDIEPVKARVISLGRSLPPFEIVTTGVGIFPGSPIYLYLSVVRSPRLTVLQRAVVEEISHHCQGSESVWAPVRWMPHITLATFPEGAKIGRAVESLMNQQTAFSFQATALTLVEGEPEASIILSAPLVA
jgi:2'-5' RNA ligase